MSLSNRIIEQQRPVDRWLSILNPLWSRAVTIIELQVVAIRHQRICESKIRILFDGPSKMLDRLFETILRSRIPKVKAPQIFVISAGICGVAFRQLLPFVGAQVKRKRSSNVIGNRVLNSKDVSKGL